MQGLNELILGVASTFQMLVDEVEPIVTRRVIPRLTVYGLGDTAR
jgi:hypothetical protein